MVRGLMEQSMVSDHVIMAMFLSCKVCSFGCGGRVTPTAGGRTSGCGIGAAVRTRLWITEAACRRRPGTTIVEWHTAGEVNSSVRQHYSYSSAASISAGASKSGWVSMASCGPLHSTRRG